MPIDVERVRGAELPPRRFAWEDGDRITIEARAVDRDAPVLTNAAILRR